MKANRIILFLFPALLMAFYSCEKMPHKPDLPEEVLILNHWIWEGLNDVYLWEEHIPDLDPDYQEDPEQYFFDLLYPGDHYSWIEKDYEALEAMFDGVELSTGMSARPGFFNGPQVISVVEYVTTDSPAEDSAIRRGDIIVAIDGQTLTADNYYPLFYQNTATFEFGDWDGSRVLPNGRKITLTAVELNQNPVNHHKVIEYQGKKIGYLVYTQFTFGRSEEWLEELNSTLREFISEGVTDVVVDLRYNRGGYDYVSAYLASCLGPRSAMENGEVFVKMVWNSELTEYWKEEDLDKDGQPDGDNSSELVMRLPESSLNLDLSKIYFLTTDMTASASEALITSLYPYMDVVQIGTTTYGKCYGSWTIPDRADPKRHNWAMQPVVLKYANAEGFTDFVNGIDPDFEVTDDLLNAKPFGSLEDPLLARALEEITGVAPQLKSLGLPSGEFNPLPVPVNRMVEHRFPTAAR